jgi:hypothetical protein
MSFLLKQKLKETPLVLLESRIGAIASSAKGFASFSPELAPLLPVVWNWN